MDELLAYVNEYNGSSDVFISLYAFKEVLRVEDRIRINYQSAIVDKLFVDLDGARKTGEAKKPLRAYEDAQVLHEWACGENYKHIPFFSGNCYQVYFFLEENLKNPPIAIKNFLAHLGRSLHILIDPKIRGNMAQLVRYPDTWNPKGRRFCISPPNFAELSHEEIVRLARKQQGKIHIYGYRLLDLSPWDKDMPLPSEYCEPVKWTPELSAKMDKVVTNLGQLDIPLCIKRLMTFPELGYEGRWIVITYFCEMGMPRAATHKIMESFLSAKKFRHCTQEEAWGHGGMINYIYNKAEFDEENEGYALWSCAKLREYGYCVEGCDRKHPIYDV